MNIAIHAKPCTVLRRLAVQKRTVFGGAPCTELCAYRYTYTKAANLYVNPQTRTVAAFCYTSRKNTVKPL